MIRLLLTVACALSLVACGRRATEADCNAIIDRNVEIQLKAMNITDAPTVQKRQTELRTSLRDEVKSCVGRRVTDGMMACVKQANTPDQVDACLR